MGKIPRSGSPTPTPASVSTSTSTSEKDQDGKNPNIHEICLICSRSPLPFDSKYSSYQSVKKATRKIFKHLIIPEKNLKKIGKSRWISYCHKCMSYVKEIARFQRQAEILDLRIQSIVEKLGRRVIKSSDVKAQKDSIIWTSFKQPVVQNFLLGELPNPTVKLSIDPSLILDNCDNEIENNSDSDDDQTQNQNQEDGREIDVDKDVDVRRSRSVSLSLDSEAQNQSQNPLDNSNTTNEMPQRERQQQPLVVLKIEPVDPDVEMVDDHDLELETMTIFRGESRSQSQNQGFSTSVLVTPKNKTVSRRDTSPSQSHTVSTMASIKIIGSPENSGEINLSSRKIAKSKSRRQSRKSLDKDKADVVDVSLLLAKDKLEHKSQPVTNYVENDPNYGQEDEDTDNLFIIRKIRSNKNKNTPEIGDSPTIEVEAEKVKVIPKPGPRSKRKRDDDKDKTAKTTKKVANEIEKVMKIPNVQDQDLDVDSDSSLDDLFTEVKIPLKKKQSLPNQKKGSLNNPNSSDSVIVVAAEKAGAEDGEKEKAKTSSSRNRSSNSRGKEKRQDGDDTNLNSSSMCPSGSGNNKKIDKSPVKAREKEKENEPEPDSTDFDDDDMFIPIKVKRSKRLSLSKKKSQSPDVKVKVELETPPPRKSKLASTPTPNTISKRNSSGTGTGKKTLAEILKCGNIGSRICKSPGNAGVADPGPGGAGTGTGTGTPPSNANANPPKRKRRPGSGRPRKSFPRKNPVNSNTNANAKKNIETDNQSVAASIKITKVWSEDNVNNAEKGSHKDERVAFIPIHDLSENETETAEHNQHQSNQSRNRKFQSQSIQSSNSNDGGDVEFEIIGEENSIDLDLDQSLQWVGVGESLQTQPLQEPQPQPEYTTNTSFPNANENKSSTSEPEIEMHMESSLPLEPKSRTRTRPRRSAVSEQSRNQDQNQNQSKAQPQPNSSIPRRGPSKSSFEDTNANPEIKGEEGVDYFKCPWVADSSGMPGLGCGFIRKIIKSNFTAAFSSLVNHFTHHLKNVKEEFELGLPNFYSCIDKDKNCRFRAYITVKFSTRHQNMALKKLAKHYLERHTDIAEEEEEEDEEDISPSSSSPETQKSQSRTRSNPVPVEDTANANVNASTSASSNSQSQPKRPKGVPWGPLSRRKLQSPPETNKNDGKDKEVPAEPTKQNSIETVEGDGKNKGNNNDKTEKTSELVPTRLVSPPAPSPTPPLPVLERWNFEVPYLNLSDPDRDRDRELVPELELEVQGQVEADLEPSNMLVRATDTSVSEDSDYESICRAVFMAEKNVNHHQNPSPSTSRSTKSPSLSKDVPNTNTSTSLALVPISNELELESRQKAITSSLVVGVPEDFRNEGEDGSGGAAGELTSRSNLTCFRCQTCGVPWPSDYEALLEHNWSHFNEMERSTAMYKGIDVPKPLREVLIKEGRNYSSFSFSETLVAEIISRQMDLQKGQFFEVGGNPKSINCKHCHHVEIVPDSESETGSASGSGSEGGLVEWTNSGSGSGLENQIQDGESSINSAAKKNIIIHFLQEHFKRDYICTRCGQGFSDQHFLDRHYEISH